MDGLIYAYHAPKSTGQQQYTAARLAQLQEERRQHALNIKPDSKEPSVATSLHLERTLSNQSSSAAESPSPVASSSLKDRHRRETSNAGEMEVARAHTGLSSNSSSLLSEQQQQQQNHQNLLNNPFELRHGRRYLRELPYPLPCDLPEIQRQNVRTLLSCRVFGRAVCSPHASAKATIPQRVLEIGCGSGYWSAMCHDYFTSLGHDKVAFTGLDIAPLTPDLRKQGVNWTFVQHDVRRSPLPFPDEDFDLVMLKDLSLVLTLGAPFQRFLDETIRILRVGGTLEIWESDHVLRSLTPHPPPPLTKQKEDQETANRTGTFLIAPGTPFSPAQNRYLAHANNWISEALDRRRLPPMPCARLAQVLYQEPESLGDVGIRRVAIPLGELRWERSPSKTASQAPVLTDSPLSTKGKGRQAAPTHSAVDKPLTSDQLAIRQTALLTVLQAIESLEPLLKEVSGKNAEEWSHWWASMMADLLDPSRGAWTGECLEIGAWWATKLAAEVVK